MVGVNKKDIPDLAEVSVGIVLLSYLFVVIIVNVVVLYPRQWDRCSMTVSRVVKTNESWELFNKPEQNEVPGVGRNMVPDTWTTDGEGALPELSLCPYDKLVVLYISLFRHLGSTKHTEEQADIQTQPNTRACTHHKKIIKSHQPHPTPTRKTYCPLVDVLSTNFTRRCSINTPISGKSQKLLISLIQLLSWVAKIFATTWRTQRSNDCTKRSDKGITSVAYNINGRQYDLNSCNVTISDCAPLLLE